MANGVALVKRKWTIGAADKKMDHKRKAVTVDEKSKNRSLRYYRRCRNMAKTIRKCPYCSRSAFYTWLQNEGQARMIVRKFIPYLEIT